MGQNPQSEVWQQPVARALAEIHRLPGLARGRVGFDQVGLAGQPWGPMRTATIHAFAPASSVAVTVQFAVRLAAQGTSYVVRDHHGRTLTARGVASALDLPLASSQRAFYLLKTALAQTLALYNSTHTPTRPGTPRPSTGPEAGEPWPFGARTSDQHTVPGRSANTRPAPEPRARNAVGQPGDHRTDLDQHGPGL